MNLHSLSGGFTCIYRCTTVRLLSLIWKMRGCGKLMNNGMEMLNPFDKKYNFLHLLFIFYLGVYMSMCMFLCVCICMCMCLHVCVFVSMSVCKRTMWNSHFSPTSYRLLVFNTDLQVGFVLFFNLTKYGKYCQANISCSTNIHWTH